MRGKMTKEASVDMVHQLELACKDSLSNQLFKEIDQMLLKLYYLYA